MIRILTLAALLPALAGCDGPLDRLSGKPSEAQIYYEALEAQEAAPAPQPELTGQAPVAVLPEPVYEEVAVVEPVVVEVVVEPVVPEYVPPVYVQPCYAVFRVSSCDAAGNVTDWVWPQ